MEVVACGIIIWYYLIVASIDLVRSLGRLPRSVWREESRESR